MEMKLHATGLSFGYMTGEGIVKETGFQGYNLRFVSLLNIFTWLKMNAGVSLNYNTSSLKESAVIPETSPLLTSLAKSPLLNPYQYDIEGNELTTLAEVDEIGISNPLATIENYEATNTNYNFTSSLGIEGDHQQGYDPEQQFQFQLRRVEGAAISSQPGNGALLQPGGLQCFQGRQQRPEFLLQQYLPALYTKTVGTDHSICFQHRGEHSFQQVPV